MRIILNSIDLVANGSHIHSQQDVNLGLQMIRRSFLAALETEDAGLADIERLLQSFLDAAERSDGPNGCMVCSTSQEEIASDPDVKVRVDAYFDRIRAAYRNTLFRAAARGDVALTDPAIHFLQC